MDVYFDHYVPIFMTKNSKCQIIKHINIALVISILVFFDMGPKKAF